MKVNIATAESYNAMKWKNQQWESSFLIAKLATTTRTPETVAEYQSMDKDSKLKVKNQGGFVGGKLNRNERKTENVISRSFLSLDADKADVGFIERYTKQCKYESVLYTTHSHTPEKPRVRLIVFLKRDITPDEYNAVSRFFAAEWDINQFDKVSFSPAQMMFWPSTPFDGEYIYKAVHGDVLDPDVILKAHPDWTDLSTLPHIENEATVNKPGSRKQADPLTKKGLIGAFNRTYYPITKAIDKFLSDVYESTDRDDRYSFINSKSIAGVRIYDAKFIYSFHATDPAYGMLLNAYDMVRVHRFGTDEDSKSLMDEFASGIFEVSTLLQDEREAEAKAEFEAINETNWKGMLKRDLKGKIKNSIPNIALIVQYDEYLKNIVYNELSHSMEIQGEVPWNNPSKHWRDADEAQYVYYVEKMYGTFSARNYNVGLKKIVDDRRYHPIKLYFENLPVWDGIKRVDTLLIDYLGAPDNEYVRAVTRKTLCAAVRRIQEPGIKFDQILVLNGPQGIGKSTLVSKLGMEWYSDSLAVSDMNDKSAAEKLQGYWIMEIGELAGLKKADVDKVKAFASRQDDKYRASYGHVVESHPRQCILIGTTNADAGYLRDTTGNRRFWAISTPGGGTLAPWDISQAEVDQIWSEAKEIAKTEDLFLSKELVPEAEKEQRNAMEVDEREGLVHDYLELLLPDNWDNMSLNDRRDYIDNPGEFMNPIGTIQRQKVTNMEIWSECFGYTPRDMKPSDSYKIAAIMARIDGWQKSNKSMRTKLYGRQRYYIRIKEQKK